MKKDEVKLHNVISKSTNATDSAEKTFEVS